MPNLLDRIAEQLARETDPYLRAEASAVRASYLARIGRFDECRHQISGIRQVFGDGRSARVTILLMIAEALLLHFERLETGAYDRVRRAELLALATKDRGLTALVSAWKAHLDFESSNFASMARSLKAVDASAGETDHAALSRSATVLHNCMALCGRAERGHHWFTEARKHALADGDHATLDAIQYGRASFGMARVQADWCQGLADESALERTSRELASSRNLQLLTQTDALKHYLDLCESRLCVMKGDWQGAIHLLAKLKHSGPFPKAHFTPELLVLELAYCRASLPTATALSESDVAGVSRLEQLDVDDQLWVARLKLGLAKQQQRNVGEAEAQFADAVSKYLAWVKDLNEALADNGLS